MKKLTATFLTLFILEGAGQLVGGTVNAIFPGQKSDVTSARSAIWAQHQAEYELGTDPSGMSVTG